MRRSAQLLLLALALTLVAALQPSAPAAAQEGRLPFDLEVDVEFKYLDTRVANVWFFTVTNHGEEETFGVVVRTELPHQRTLRITKGAAFERSTGVWNVGRLPAGASKELHVEVQLSSYPPHFRTLPGRAVVSNTYPVEPEILRHNQQGRGMGTHRQQPTGRPHT